MPFRAKKLFGHFLPDPEQFEGIAGSLSFEFPNSLAGKIFHPYVVLTR
jgi:hypothetical protein